MMCQRVRSRRRRHHVVATQATKPCSGITQVVVVGVSEWQLQWQQHAQRVSWQSSHYIYVQEEEAAKLRGFVR